MINWDELKHIHVIKKLKHLLAQWYDLEIFFVDEQGTPRNYQPSKDQEFKNPLCHFLLSQEKGQEMFLKFLEDSNDKAAGGNLNHFEVDGPLGFEKGFVSRIFLNKEYVGSIVAYSYLNSAMDSESKKKIKAKLKSAGLDLTYFEAALEESRNHNQKDKKYFFELVDLIANEMIDFYTEITKREERINALNTELGSRYSYDSMIGKSKPMQELYSLLDKIKNSDSPVLVQGENGTGKELIAKSIHFNSVRKDATFVTINCSAFNENLLDSELFGHVKGSFTGAVKDKKGLFEVAHNGTLFMDEVGDMPLSMQVKLLRVLQEGTLTPVGGTDVKKVDVRVIAATNKNLKEMIENGEFREDLYYRINVINVFVPPLRERKEDIPLLIDSFLVRGCDEKKVPLKQLAKRTIEKIYDYPWPGNIRELENEIERLIVLSGDEKRISADMISARIRDFGATSKVKGVAASGRLKDAIEELEKTMIREGLRRTKWNKSRLAKELGISRAGLIMKVEKYDLDKRTIAMKKKDGAA